MKFTLSWLKKHLDTHATLEEIVSKLNLIGLEVDKVMNPAETLGAFVVAEISSLKKHPDADKLSLCEVYDGTQTYQVVCGARNVKQGMKGVFAPIGTYVPGLDVTLKKTKIRGVESQGMMCSEEELDLADSSEGIIECPQDAPVGSSYINHLGLDDPIIEIDITPNRGDCLGVRGIARDLAAAGMGRLIDLSESNKFSVEEECSVKLSAEFASNDAACLQFALRKITGIENKESPNCLKNTLQAIDQKAISYLVDVTNFMTFDQNRPLHVFDADKVKGDLVLRYAVKGESFLALNDVDYILDDNDIVICDSEGDRIISLAGIIGGKSTSCDFKTKNVLIECALFDPILVAKTGRRLGIQSDARFRFERSVDPASVIPGIDQATKMILEYCGGKASRIEVLENESIKPQSVEYKFEKFKTHCGFSIEKSKVKTILESLGFKILNDSESSFLIEIPTWRSDISMPEDIVEELARIYGMDNIPSVPLPTKILETDQAWTTQKHMTNNMRRSLVQLGYLETVTWSFLSEKEAKLFSEQSDEDIDDLTILNPISQELSVMRPSILPNLLQAAKSNLSYGLKNVKLFEVGPCFNINLNGYQELTIAGIRTGLKQEKLWNQDAVKVSVYDAKRDVVEILASRGVQESNLRIEADAPKWYHPGRSGNIYLGKMKVASFGEIHPEIIQKSKIKETVAGFEIFIDALPNAKKKPKSKFVMHRLQPLDRDFAFILEKSVSADRLMKAVRSSNKKFITGLKIFDLYEGESIGNNNKSIAVTVTLQPNESSFTDADLETISNDIIANVKKQTGGILRE